MILRTLYGSDPAREAGEVHGDWCDLRSEVSLQLIHECCKNFKQYHLPKTCKEILGIRPEIIEIIRD